MKAGLILICYTQKLHQKQTQVIMPAAHSFSTIESIYTLLKMGSYSSTTMCQYWDNRLIYWEYTDYYTNMSQ